MFLPTIMHQASKVRDQCTYFNKLQDRLDGIASSPEQKVVIGGDLNVTFDSNLDCLGRQPIKSQLSYLKKFASIWTSLIPEE